ncbi:MAG: hypothetical protein H8D67_24040 [Deltaproteobacteria bacterium]|nr:hypothetical protein [Deltaproteobacteria bacterium]
MKEKLKLEIEKGVDNDQKVGVSVNIDITNSEGSSLSGSVLLVEKCNSYEILQEEVFRIKEELDTLLERSKKLFEGEAEEEGPDVNEDMSAKGIWDILSMIKDPEMILVKFNSMSRQKRLEVADYVLAHCNVFSGPGSIFSMRYNSEEGILE